MRSGLVFSVTLGKVFKFTVPFLPLPTEDDNSNWTHRATLMVKMSYYAGQLCKRTWHSLCSWSVWSSYYHYIFQSWTVVCTYLDLLGREKLFLDALSTFWVGGFDQRYCPVRICGLDLWLSTLAPLL